MTAPAGADLIKTTLHIIYGRAIFRHEFQFYDRIGYSSHSYLFDTNDGAPVHAEFNKGQMVCQVDEEKFVEDVPADARPAYGNYPLIVTIPLKRFYCLLHSN